MHTHTHLMFKGRQPLNVHAVFVFILKNCSTFSKKKTIILSFSFQFLLRN